MQTLGRYQVLAELGRGTMGVVYRGYDPVLERSVALKTVLLPESIPAAHREAFLERFFLETRIAAKLHHPNIVVTYDASTDASTAIPFMAMELVEGEVLTEWLEREGRLSWREGLGIVIPVGEALHYADALGVVHRDIKPANILLTAEGTPKVTDFGIAKLSTVEITLAGAVLGTPLFMSPEQLRGEPIDGRSDQFSLGALLYALIAGRSPFAAPEIAAIAQKVERETPGSLSDFDPNAPAELDHVLGRALSKAAADRYATTLQFVEQLRTVLEGETTADRELGGRAPHDAGRGGETIGADPPVRRSGRRMRLLVGAATLGIGAFLLADRFGIADLDGRAGPLVDRLGLVGDWAVRETAKLEARYLALQAEEQETADLRSQAEALLRSSAPLAERGEWDRALQASEEALRLYRRAEDGVGEASVLMARGRLRSRSGDWARAKPDLESAAAVFAIYGQPDGEARSLVLLGNLERARGDLKTADALYRQALMAAESLEEDGPRFEALLERGLLQLLEGRLGGARRSLEWVHRQATDSTLGEIASRASLYLGLVHFVEGRNEPAFARWQQARQLYEARRDLAGAAETAVWEGRAAMLLGEQDRAGAQLGSALREYRALDHLPGLVAALGSVAELAQLSGRESEAQASREELAALRGALGLSDAALESLPPPAAPRSPSLETGGRGEATGPAERLRFLLEAPPRTALSEALVVQLQPRQR